MTRRKVLLALLLLSLAIPAVALERQPSADYRARRVAVSRKTNGGLVLLFAGVEPAGPNDLYGFRQDDNFYYLSGWTEPGAALLIAPEISTGSTRRPYAEILFLPGRNASQEQWTGRKLGPDDPDAARITGFDRVEILDKLRDQLVRLLRGPHATIYTDLPELQKPSTAATPLEWLFRSNAFPAYASFEDAKPMLAELRRGKDAGDETRC